MLLTRTTAAIIIQRYFRSYIRRRYNVTNRLDPCPITLMPVYLIPRHKFVEYQGKGYNAHAWARWLCNLRIDPTSRQIVSREFRDLCFHKAVTDERLNRRCADILFSETCILVENTDRDFDYKTYCLSDICTIRALHAVEDLFYINEVSTYCFAHHSIYSDCRYDDRYSVMHARIIKLLNMLHFIPWETYHLYFYGAMHKEIVINYVSKASIVHHLQVQEHRNRQENPPPFPPPLPPI